jgi:tetratricopeptide (TPR) repeat protein
MENGAAFVDQALSLNSNLALAWSGSGWMKLCFGELDTAMKHSERAMRLSPFDRGALLWQAEMGLIHFCAGRYTDAALWAERALRIQPDYAFGLRVLSASKAMEGHTEQAQKAMAQLRRVDPQLRLSNIDNVISPLQPEHRARYIEGLRAAGLPE